MKMKTSKMVMKCIGVTLAICSILSMVDSSDMLCTSSTKKTMKKTINRFADVVDSIATML